MSAIVLVTCTPASDGAGELAAYQKLALPVIARHGGEMIFRGPRTATFVGSDDFTVSVAFRFPSADAARAWYDDPDYRAALPHRDKAFTSIDIHLIEA
jgi:uncharacterized protein (DUF1330 family)